MSDFLTGAWDLFSGMASGPLGWFAVALAISSILVAVLLIFGRGGSNLNGHNPMPGPYKSKENDR